MSTLGKPPVTRPIASHALFQTELVKAVDFDAVDGVINRDVAAPLDRGTIG
jgi:hypothetical protein